MSTSSSLTIGGFLALLAVSGEDLSYGAGSVRGLVNRVVKTARIKMMVDTGTLDFGTLGFSEIEILKDDFTGTPKDGAAFIDSTDVAHRIMYVVNTDISWICFCKPS